MNILNASISAWVALLIVTAETALVLYFAFVIHRNDEMHKLRIVRLFAREDAWREKWEKEHAQVANLRDDLVGAVTALQKAGQERDTAMQAFAELDSLHQKVVAERDKWQGLYGELVNTLHDLQGDAHATAPLQEAAPESVKRTRKKAETQ